MTLDELNRISKRIDELHYELAGSMSFFASEFKVCRRLDEYRKLAKHLIRTYERHAEEVGALRKRIEEERIESQIASSERT